MGTATVLLSRIHCFNIVNFSGDDAFAGEVNSKSLFHGILVLLLRYCWIKLRRETWLQGSQFSHLSFLSDNLDKCSLFVQIIRNLG